METILSHRWVLGSIQAIVLAPFLELGRRVAVHFRLHEEQNLLHKRALQRLKADLIAELPHQIPTRHLQDVVNERDPKASDQCRFRLAPHATPYLCG